MKTNIVLSNYVPYPHDAIKILKNGLNMASKYGPIHHSLAEVYYKIKNLKKAKKHADKGLKYCLKHNDNYKYMDDIKELLNKIEKEIKIGTKKKRRFLFF